MKNKILISSILLFVLVFFNASTPDSITKKDVVLMQLVYNSLNANHYQPRDMDDSYSEDIFKMYLKRLDYSKRFFLQEDIDKLEDYRFKLDDVSVPDIG